MTSALEDQLVIVLLTIAVAIVLMGFGQPPLLVAGLALGGCGAVLGMRGRRPLERYLRRGLLATVSLAIGLVLAVAAVGVFQSWEASNLLAMNASVAQLKGRLAELEGWRAVLSALAVLAALAALALAVVAYRRSPSESPADGTSPEGESKK